MPTYKGFSTVSPSSQKKFILVDNDLIKQDLLNAFMVQRGSRVMQPQFGCIVWEKLFENLTSSDVTDIADNITNIVNSDPRVNLVSIDITQSQNTITVTLVLLYVATDETETLVVTFDANSQSVYAF